MPDDRVDSPGRPPERPRGLPALLVWITALLALIALAAVIFSPFIDPILIALILATIGQPFFALVLRLMGERRRGIASAITCAVLVVLVIVPLFWIGWSMAIQARDGVTWAAKGTLEMAARLEKTSWFRRALNVEWIGGSFEQVKTSLRNLERIQADPGTGMEDPPAPPPAPVPDPRAEDGKAPPADRDGATDPGEGVAPPRPPPAVLDIAGWVTRTVQGILANALQVFLQFCLMVFILFYFLRDGPQLLGSFRRAIPVQASDQEEVMRKFRDVSRSVIRGSIGTAAAQGALAALAFLVVGIPAVFWGVMVAFSSLIPPLGTGLVLFPITVVLFLEGEWWKGGFMAVVMVAIGMLDNLLRPFLVGRTLRTHPIWLLLSILGGISAFGPMGLIYGPLVLVLLTTMFALFVKEEKTRDEGSLKEPGAR
jgi:predicted PurR-regulated permease PerM